MPDMNDFHGFKSTSGGSGCSGGGCSGSVFTWILIIIGVLWLIGKLSA